MISLAYQPLLRYLADLVAAEIMAGAVSRQAPMRDLRNRRLLRPVDGYRRVKAVWR